MAETNEELAAQISKLANEKKIIGDQIDDLLKRILNNCPVELDDKVEIIDRNGASRHAYISSIGAAESGKYYLRCRKAKKDGSKSLISEYIYSAEKITRLSDGFDVRSIMK